MKINSIGAQLSFGKTRVLSAKVKNLKSNELESATLYKMDSKNFNDQREMENAASSKEFYWIQKDFQKDGNMNPSLRNFYLLTTDNGNKPIAAAETSDCILEFYNPDKNGRNVVIQELASDKGYKEAHLPVLAQIVDDSVASNAKNIFTAFRSDELPSLKSGSFSETRHNTWMLPKKRYDTLLSIATRKADINFYA